MKLIFNFIFLTIIISSCKKNDSNISGYWSLNFDNGDRENILPYVLNFQNDTLITVDEHNFKQTSKYKINNDSIYITSKNGAKEKYSFSIISDSIISFSNKEFFRVSKDFFPETQSYELLNWKSGEKFKRVSNSTVVHLIKQKSVAKVILNDKISNLNKLPEFLTWSHNKKPTVYLYIGKGIELKDLTDVYCWMKYCGYRKVELVIANNSIESFLSIKDAINIDDVLFSTFIKAKKLPPLPLRPRVVDKSKNIDVICINSKNELKHLNNSKIYRYNISNQLDINSYLELIQQLQKEKKIKRLTTICNRNAL